MNKKFLAAILIAFVVLSIVFFLMKTYMPAFRFSVLMTGNTIMAALSLGSYLLIMGQMDSKPSAFVRGVTSASFLKLMVCMIGLLAYVLINKPDIHKPTVFALFGIYIIYTAIETALLSKQAREAK